MIEKSRLSAALETNGRCGTIVASFDETENQ